MNFANNQYPIIVVNALLFNYI